MLKITTWRPDTCGCELHYSWDSETTEDDRVHTPIETHDLLRGRTTQRCERHAHHTNVHALHEAVIAENQAKNRKVN